MYKHGLNYYFTEVFCCIFLFYQFLQSSTMRAPGFTNCQSDPLGHTHDALPESSPSNAITVRIKHQLINQLIYASLFSDQQSPDLTRSRVVGVFAATVFSGDAFSILENQVAWTTTALLATKGVQALCVTMKVRTGARARFPTGPFLRTPTAVCRRQEEIIHIVLKKIFLIERRHQEATVA